MAGTPPGRRRGRPAGQAASFAPQRRAGDPQSAPAQCCRTREGGRPRAIPSRSIIASMLSFGPDNSWLRIARASATMAARPALTFAAAPFSMTRRLPLPARRSLASIDRTTGSRSGRCSSACAPNAAATFAQLSRMSIRSAATVTPSTISRATLVSSMDGRASHR